MEADSFWLDRLPLDVCTRIAKRAESSNHQSAIQLAVASPIQRTALLRAVQHKLDFPKIENQCFADIVTVKLQDASDTASNNEQESGSDNQRESASDLNFASPCPHAVKNYPDDEDDDRVRRQTDGHSSDRNFSDHNEQDSSDSVTNDSNADCETDSPSDTETKNESGNVDVSASGIEEAKGYSSDQDRIRSHEGVEIGSHGGTEDGNSDHETDRRPDDANENENKSGSDDRNVSTSGDIAGNSSNDSDEGGPVVDEQFQKFVEISFVRSYSDLLCDGVREIVIHGDTEDIFKEPTIQACLASSSLLKLCIRIPPPDMLPIRLGCNICSLELLLHDGDILILLRGFSSLELRELKILVAGEQCLHDRLSNDPVSHGLLAGLFPQVEKLDLACAFCGVGEEDPPWYLWNVIEKFQNLKEVTLSERVPDRATERLRKMERVTLITGDIRKLVENIPDRITSISPSRIWPKLLARRAVLREHEIEKLSNCVQLAELNCIIRQGAECGLAAIAGSLRSLGLAFAQDEPDEDSWGSEPVPLEPKKGALLEFVKSAPLLKSLHLVNMRVQRDELREMLIACGARLEEFQEEVFVETVVDQYRCYGRTFILRGTDNKLVMENFAKTLRTVALHNPKLKTLQLDVRAGWFTDAHAVLSTLPKLKASVEVLQRHASGLNTRSLIDLILKFETGRFGVIDMMMSAGVSGIAMVGAPFMEL